MLLCRAGEGRDWHWGWGWHTSPQPWRASTPPHSLCVHAQAGVGAGGAVLASSPTLKGQARLESRQGVLTDLSDILEKPHFLLFSHPPEDAEIQSDWFLFPSKRSFKEVVFR